MDAAFFRSNRTKLGQTIGNGLVLLHSGIKKSVSSKENYGFRPNKMFYYLTGLAGPGMVLLLAIDKGKTEEMLFAPKEEPDRERWEGKGKTIEEMSNESLIRTIHRLDTLPQHLDHLLGIAEDSEVWINIGDNQAEELKTHFNVHLPFSQAKNIHPILEQMRATKTKCEVDRLKCVISLASAGIVQVMEAVKKGMYEYELEAFFDFAMKSSGLKTGQYHTILASGKNASILHYLDNDCVIQQDDLVLIDIDVEKDYYHCDFTRVFPASGKFTDRQREVYNAVLSVQKEIISKVKPGVAYGELNELSKELLFNKCIELNLATDREQLDQYYFHNIGHFIGLDTHDVGELKDETLLAAGMVLTIEPGLYIPDENMGIRIEDMILVTETDNENLTEGLLKDPNEIEILLSKVKGC